MILMAPWFILEKPIDVIGIRHSNSDGGRIILGIEVLRQISKKAIDVAMPENQ